MDDRKSLSIAIRAISDQYAAFLFFEFLYTMDLINDDGLFICYVGDISGTNGEEINSVAICGGFTHFHPYMHWTNNPKLIILLCIIILTTCLNIQISMIIYDGSYKNT